MISVVSLQGGRPGIRLESAVVSEACGIELVRIYFTAFNIAPSRAEYYLKRPEPFAWALASLMTSDGMTPDALLEQCRLRIATAPHESRVQLEAFLQSAIAP